MIHPSRETLDHEIEQQTRLVRGLMAALYARIDSDPDESLLRELAKAKQALRELQQRRDVKRADAEKAQAGPRRSMGVPPDPKPPGCGSSRRSGSSRSRPASITCSTRRPTRC